MGVGMLDKNKLYVQIILRPAISPLVVLLSCLQPHAEKFPNFSRSPTDVNSSVLTTDLTEANNLSFPVLQFTTKQLGHRNINAESV